MQNEIVKILSLTRDETKQGLLKWGASSVYELIGHLVAAGEQ